MSISLNKFFFCKARSLKPTETNNSMLDNVWNHNLKKVKNIFLQFPTSTDVIVNLQGIASSAQNGSM